MDFESSRDTPLGPVFVHPCFAVSATIDRYPVLRRVSALIQQGDDSLAYGERIQALSDFREAESLELADYRPHLELSSIYSALGEARQAREEYEWTAGLNGEHPDRTH